VKEFRRVADLGGLLAALGLVLVTAFTAPEAPGASKTFRVAIILPGDEWASSVEGLKEGLKALQYAEGRDVLYLVENARGEKAKIAEFTQKVIAEKVDVIFTITNTALKVVAQESKASKIPVVFGSASGPVESGIVPAYATADSNITGVTSGSIELVPKRLEILKEVLPKTKTVALIGDLDADSSRTAFALAVESAAKMGLKALELRIASREQAVEASKKITVKQADALFLIPGLAGVGAASGIAAAAIANRVPFAAYQVEHVKKDGALMSYGSSYYLQGKQSASLLVKILKGTPVWQLPIERPALLELVINLNTVKKIGVKLSPEIINRANELVGDRKG
jgi:putative ABC transport system substrate-binding protein